MNVRLILLVFGGLTFGVAILGIVFYLGKRQGTPSISEMLEGAVDVADRFREKAEMGESVKKDLVLNFSRKGKVIREKNVEVEIPRGTEFLEKMKDEIGIELDSYLEKLGKGMDVDKDDPVISHKLLVVREKDGLIYRALSKFTGGPNTRVIFTPSDTVRFEDDEKIVLSDIDLEPDGNGVWTPSFLSSSLGYQKVAYQDLWSVLLSMMSENMRHIQHFNIKHSQDVEKLQLMDSDRFGSGIAGDVNKFGKD